MFRRLNPRMFQAQPLQRCTLTRCKAACCAFGVWVDQVEIRDILSNAKRISHHLPADQANPVDWFNGRKELDEYSLSGFVEHTSVISSPGHEQGTACIFLRQEDHKCALQVAAETDGFHKWRFKPFYCILHPLDLDSEGRITLDEIQSLLAEPGSCLRPAPEPKPLLETFAEELAYLVENRFPSVKNERDKRWSSGQNSDYS